MHGTAQYGTAQQPYPQNTMSSAVTTSPAAFLKGLVQICVAAHTSPRAAPAASPAAMLTGP